MGKKTKITIKGRSFLVDIELTNIIKKLNECKTIETLACCSGHDRYPMTIIARISPHPIIIEIFSNKKIERKRNFYRKDKKGFFYLPEVCREKN